MENHNADDLSFGNSVNAFSRTDAMSLVSLARYTLSLT